MEISSGNITVSVPALLAVDALDLFKLTCNYPTKAGWHVGYVRHIKLGDAIVWHSKSWRGFNVVDILYDKLPIEGLMWDESEHSEQPVQRKQWHNEHQILWNNAPAINIALVVVKGKRDDDPYRTIRFDYSPVKVWFPEY